MIQVRNKIRKQTRYNQEKANVLTDEINQTVMKLFSFGIGCDDVAII